MPLFTRRFKRKYRYARRDLANRVYASNEAREYATATAEELKVNLECCLVYFGWWNMLQQQPKNLKLIFRHMLLVDFGGCLVYIDVYKQHLYTHIHLVHSRDILILLMFIEINKPGSPRSFLHETLTKE